ncbi:MAG: aminotransferase class V-fold PLP-dependent enzyme [Motiliproteus sp.]
MSYRSGRHFLQIPGPSNVPDRILRAMDRPTIDHRGPEFAELGLTVLNGMKQIFKTDNPVIIYPASGTGAWEAALVNTLSSGDQVLMYETGQFATLWRGLAGKLGLNADFIEGDWRHGVDADVIRDRLSQDTDQLIKAVCVVHHETSTGVTSDIAAVRRAIDAAGHPALLLVDTISGLGSVDFCTDDWGVDVAITCSQKGLMLPPGLSFNTISPKALEASKSANLPRSYWGWNEMLQTNVNGFFPYSPATNLLYGLEEAIAMLLEEGLDNVFARHARFSEAARRAVRAWGLEVLSLKASEHSNVLTAVMMPDSHSADRLRGVILDNFDMSLGTGLNKTQDRVFRIGHLGDFNELTLIGTLAGVEMGLACADVPYIEGGVQAAMAYLAETAPIHSEHQHNRQAVA